MKLKSKVKVEIREMVKLKQNKIKLKSEIKKKNTFEIKWEIKQNKNIHGLSLP